MEDTILTMPNKVILFKFEKKLQKIIILEPACENNIKLQKYSSSISALIGSISLTDTAFKY